MSERTVSVRVRMIVRDLVTGAAEGSAATERLRRSQERLGDQAKRTAADLTVSAAAAKSFGNQMRGMKYAGIGLAAVGATGGALKLLPPLLSATGAAAGALPGILGGAAMSVGVLKVATKGLGDALSEVYKQDDPFASLSKNARRLVAEASQLRPQIEKFQRGLSNRALRGTDADLARLASVTLPALAGSANMLADDWADAFAAITVAASDRQVLGSLNTMASTTDRFFDQIIDRVAPASRAFATLVTAADPVARMIGDRLVGAIDTFTGRIQAAKASGSLDEFFKAGAQNASDLLSISGDILSIIGQVVRQANTQATSLHAVAGAMDAYVSSGRAAADIGGIMDTLITTYEGMASVLGPLGGILKDALADPGTAQAIATMFQIMAAGAQALRDVFNVFQLLPDGVQATVLAAVGLALAWKKLSVALSSIDGAVAGATARLGTMGSAGERAGRGLSRLSSAAGTAGTVLVGLEIAGTIADQFRDAAPDVDRLTDAIARFTRQGKVTGELENVLGPNFEKAGQLKGFAGDKFYQRLGRGVESLIPGGAQANEKLFGQSYTGAAEDVTALDQALAGYAKTTNDAAGTQELFDRIVYASGLSAEELRKKLPSASAEMIRLQEAGGQGSQSLVDASLRAELLGGSFQEAALRGMNLAATLDLINGKNVTAAEGQIAVERAYDAATDAFKQNGKVVEKGTHTIDVHTEKGRQNMETLIGMQKAASAAAQAEVDRTHKTEAGIPILNKWRDKFIDVATKMTGSRKAAIDLANSLFKLPDKDVKVDAKTEEALARVEDLGFKVRRLPNGKFEIDARTKSAQQRLREMGFTVKKLPNGKFSVTANTAAARARLAEAKRLLNELNGRNATATFTLNKVTIETRRTKVETQVGNARGGVHIPMQRGGVVAAQQGLLQPNIYPASNPPLYQFAEPETGGELFLPRRGDKGRGQALLGIAASWYQGMFVPMLRGGVRAAQAGLVNVGAAAAGTGAKATKLDYLEAYLRARDAVKSLTEALKENGRTFSYATAKGRANTEAVIGSIRAAQDAARTKYEETGSVAAANRAYDEHIARLRKTLQQQKINAATIRRLLSNAGRPSYDTGGGPSNSLANIAFAKSNVAAVAGVEALRDTLSLNAPAAGYATPGARDDLMAIIGFLEQASQAAQDRYTQTHNAGTATNLYNAYVAQLRDALVKAGFAKKVIDDLVNTYGHITLNARGGVYMAAGGLATLSGPAMYPSTGQPMYGFAEQSTGGELFLPRLGDQQRGRDLLSVAAGWYGGHFTPGNSGGGGTSTVVNNTLSVTPVQANLSVAELQGLMRQLDVRARVGRPG